MASPLANGRAGMGRGIGRDIGAEHGSGDRAADRGALTAFTLEGLHAKDLSSRRDSAGICNRSGHHCTQPLHRRCSQETFLNGASGHGVEPDHIAFRVHQDRDEAKGPDRHLGLLHTAASRHGPPLLADAVRAAEVGQGAAAS